MLQLQQYVSGEALIAIENLGFSPAAYEAAKDRLKRKYGGMHRQKASFMEDLEHSSRYSLVTLRSWNDSQTCWI